MKRTISSETKPFVTLPVGQLNTDGTVNGNSVDRNESKNFFRLAHLLIITGTISDGTHTFAFEVSDDDTDWRPARSEFLSGALPTVDSDDSDSVFELSYTGYERYLRASVTVDVSGVEPSGGTYGAILLMHGARRTPV